MAANTHRPNCANAQSPGCVCSGCGGALHGWQGWIQLASDPRTRDDRRRRIKGKIERNRRTGELSYNSRNRQASVDLARLDITDYLSATSTSSPPSDQPIQRADAADPAISPTDLDRLSALGETIMADTWWEISAEIDRYVEDERTALDVKKNLADHAWCGLLVALIRWIEQINHAVQFLSDTGEKFVKDFVVERLSRLSRNLAEAVADIVVDRVWSALAKLVEAHFPMLGEDTLRALRMLALFTCPWWKRRSPEALA